MPLDSNKTSEVFSANAKKPTSKAIESTVDTYLLDPSTGQKERCVEASGYRINHVPAGSYEKEVPKGWALLDINLAPTEGKFSLNGIEDAPERSDARSFSFIPAAQSHKFQFTRSGSSVQFMYQPNSLENVPGKDALNSISSAIWNVPDTPMISAAEIFIDYMRSGLCESYAEKKAFLRDLFAIRLIQLIENKECDKSVYSPAIQRALEFIEANIDQPVLHKDIARAAGQSEFHFARSFRTATGLSVKRYIMLRRLEVAQDLIMNTNESLAEVAFSTGFSSQSHMCTLFKRFTGRTPRSYRQRTPAIA
ncbi:MAG: AraC family transcriptional regulator [Pseudomonadota bacterium]